MGEGGKKNLSEGNTQLQYNSVYNYTIPSK